MLRDQFRRAWPKAGTFPHPFGGNFICLEQQIRVLLAGKNG
jgi:hypothetical protein